MSLKAKVKQTILDCLIHKCDREYDRTYQYAQKYLSYGNLIPILEKKENVADSGACLEDVKRIALESFGYSWKEKLDIERLREAAQKANYVLFCEQECFLHRNAKEKIVSFLYNHPETLVLYGDEDVIDENGVRSNPWFKPAWSPTLFLQVHYFGGLSTVESGLLLKALDELAREGDTQKDVRHLLYEVCKGAEGFQKRGNKIAHLDKVLSHQPFVAAYDKYLCCEKLSAESDGEAPDAKVSVVIPSKDHVDVLFQNLRSLDRTIDLPIEVIIVDNGSTEENRNKIEKLIQELTYDVKYIYEPMDFNFSAMCNRGARESQGELLLFLNDDIEACQNGWLQTMILTAQKDYVGCVGAKLLYPGTNKIQHAGVANLCQGPVHKLQFQEDDKWHYFGWNKQDRECLAVTGACLMIKRAVFEEVEGFDEELPVTFNDIDLCYKLYAKGFYNVCLNSIYLYHHESLSRGVDSSEAKKLRLMQERERLYERHAFLLDKDPFYHRLLNRQTSDMRILPELEETLGLQLQKCECIPWTENTWKDARRHEGVMCGVEANATGQTKGSMAQITDCEGYLKGYLVMLGDDNACYEKRLVLTNAGDGKAYWCRLNDTLREDIQRGMPDQKNIALSGFEVKIAGLPAGEYEVKAVAHNKIAGISYWKETQCRVSITEE